MSTSHRFSPHNDKTKTINSCMQKKMHSIPPFVNIIHNDSKDMRQLHSLGTHKRTPVLYEILLTQQHESHHMHQMRLDRLSSTATQ